MASTFRLQIVTSDRMFYDEEVEMVVVTTEDGEIGILAGHVPIISPLVVGKVKIKTDGRFEEAATSKGFIQVKPGLVRIVTDAAEWPGEIDVERAEAAKQRAEDRLGSGKSHIDIIRAEAALQRAINRLRVAGQ